MRTIMHTPMVSNRQPSGPHAQLYRYTQFGKGVQSHECSSVSTLRNIGLQRSMMAAQPHVSTAAAEEPRTSGNYGGKEATCVFDFRRAEYEMRCVDLLMVPMPTACRHES